LAVAAFRRRPPTATHGRLLDHVEELRRRILVVAATALAGTLAALTVRVEWRTVAGMRLPVPIPALYDTLAAQVFRAVARHVVPPGVQLVVTSPVDGFQAQFTVALAVGILVGVPTLLVQFARFVGPALDARERRFLRRSLLPALVLFALGAAFGYAVVLPVTLRALYQFSGTLGAQSLLQVGELSSFVVGFLVAFGVAFQAPLAMVALSRIGLVEPRTYWRYWRHAVLIIVVAAGILTPDPTVVSQALLAVPLLGLYVLGAAVASRAARPASAGSRA
jgi:sec-independent protein translocase protein TatC